MSLTSTPDARRPSPKRKRSGSEASNYDSSGADERAKLHYAYDEDSPSDVENSFHTPREEHDGDEEAGVKRRRVEQQPTRLNYVLHMTLRGHKRGVAAAKFSPDGRWIASCCKIY